MGKARDYNVWRRLRSALIGNGIAHLGAEQLRLSLGWQSDGIALMRQVGHCDGIALIAQLRCSNELNRSGAVRDAWANQSDESVKSG